MRKYQNLPSINIELLDGNLKIDQPITGPVVLVVGTAYSGPSNTQFLASDSNVASAVYGSESPLIQKMSEAKMGGAENILLYRVGGVAAEIADLFGSNTLITTREETSAAGSKYGMYIGPRPNDAGNAGMIIFEGDTIVYSNMPGAEVDLGKFNIIGFDTGFAYTVGTPTAPILMKDVLANVLQEGTQAETGDGATTTYSLLGSGITAVTAATEDAVPVTFTVVGTDIIFDVAPANLSAIVITGTIPVDVNTLTPVPTYTPGADNIGASWKKYYELLDLAYADLETTLATHLVTDLAILDAPNIADGSVAVDRLEYLRKEEVAGAMVYEWSTDKILYVMGGTGDTTDINLADLDENGQPIVKYRYSEVNFAHQMGTWLHDITENDRFVLGTIGTSGPVANTTSAISDWLGSLPQTDVNGGIIVDGSGLLGNRYMAGSTTQGSGFFATDSGYPDGNILADSNGAPIELGKYLSVTMGVVVTPNNPTLGTGLNQTNVSALYAGLLSGITPGNSTTNVAIPFVGLPFTIKKIKLDELTFAGYVSLADRTRGTTVVSGELATSENSDYDYVSTAIIVGDVVKSIRERLEPFLGKGLNQITIAAAETAVEAIFQAAVDQGGVVKYAFQVLSDPAERGQGQLRVPITIVPAFELREVSVPIKLAYDI